MWHFYFPQDNVQICFRGFPNDNHDVSSCPSNNKFSLLAYLLCSAQTPSPHPILGESDIQFGESNVSKKSICTPESSRHAPLNLFLGFSRTKWYFLPSVISFISVISHLSNVYKGEIYASPYQKYFCVQIECILVCTMTLVRFVVQLYIGEISATEESERSLHSEWSKDKTRGTVKIFIFSRAICSLPVYK